jgi:hypothetical protein
MKRLNGRALAWLAVPGLAAAISALHAQPRIAIELQGFVAPRCALTGAGQSLDFGRLDPGAEHGERAISFVLDCNAPFDAGLASEEGTLRHLEGIHPVGGFRQDLPYAAHLTLTLDDGAVLRLDCNSAAMAAAGCLASSGEATAMGTPGLLQVSLGPIDAPLMAGRYGDELRLSLNARQ